MIDFQELISVIQDNLTPDLLKPEYREINKSNPMYGHCYVATETLYHLLNEDTFKPHYGKDSNGVTHWWLENHTGNKLDVTADQYLSQGMNPPYSVGRRGAFLTKKPSKRSRVLIDRISNNGRNNRGYLPF